jgi:hypothetical protein
LAPWFRNESDQQLPGHHHLLAIPLPPALVGLATALFGELAVAAACDVGGDDVGAEREANTAAADAAAAAAIVPGLTISAAATYRSRYRPVMMFSPTNRPSATLSMLHMPGCRCRWRLAVR